MQDPDVTPDPEQEEAPTGVGFVGLYEKSGLTIPFTKQCCPPSLRESKVKSKELTPTPLNPHETIFRPCLDNV